MIEVAILRGCGYAPQRLIATTALHVRCHGKASTCRTALAKRFRMRACLLPVEAFL